MTARVWTREELDRVHPLPTGYAWVRSDDGTWAAVLTDDRGAWVDHVTVRAGEDGVGRIVFAGVEPREDVVLPVILASKGWDSLAAMADALTKLARSLELDGITHESHGDRETACACADEALGLRVAAATLRHGTVAP